MSNLRKGAKAAVKAVAVLTAVTTILSLSGFAFVGVLNVSAAAPADYGLTEGDTISASGSSDPDIYIVNQQGYKRLFVNPAIFTLYGHLSWAGVKSVSPATRDAFPTSGLFRNCESGTQNVYGLEVVSEDVAVLHWVNVTGAQAVSQDANFFAKVFCINNAEMGLYSMGSTYTSVNQVPDYNRGASPTPTPTPGPGGPLSGGAGSLDSADFVGSLNNEEVGEGENDVPVVGLDLQADNGSDLRILSVRVEFDQNGGGVSDDLDDYSDEVSIWFDGVKVAEENVSDFNEDAGVWSKSISLTGNAIVRMDQTEQLKVALSGLNNIDSVDLAGDDWDAVIANVRYVDAQGAITTEDAMGDIGVDREFDFASFATAADLELNLNEASDNPDGRVVDVDDTDGTDNVLLLTGDLEASGGDIEVKELTVNIVAAGPGSHDVADIATSVALEVDGTVVQTLQISSECGTDADVDCLFDDVDETIAEDDSVKIRVLVDVNGTADYTEGATLIASIDNSVTDAEDVNGDTLAGSDLTGTANGEEQGFYSEGVQVSFVSATATKTVGDSEPDLGTYTIKFNVSAFDTDAYVVNACEEDATLPPPAVNGQGSVFGMTGSASVTSCDLSDTSADETANGNYEVLEGSTEEFTLTVAVEGDADFVQVILESINWDDADNVAGSMNQFYTFDLEDFKTASQYLSDL